MLLQSDEPPACEATDGAGRIVVVCDHASNRIPRRLEGLGMAPDDLVTHIAWDPGAADVARQLARLLDAPLVLTGYSRLVIDCNRPLSSPELIARESAGIRVPGNSTVSPDDRVRRIHELFRPYHDTITRLLDRRAAAGRPCVLLSLHSFTPVLNGLERPWQVGVTHRHDNPFASVLLERLSAPGDLLVGHNRPYPIEDACDYTIPVHGEQRHLPHALVEIRQDELKTPRARAGWAHRLADACRRPSGASSPRSAGADLSRR